MIPAELGSLTAALRQLQEYNARLIVQERSGRLDVVRSLSLALVLFLAGGLCGIVLEKRQTTDVLSYVVLRLSESRRRPLPWSRQRCI